MYGPKVMLQLYLTWYMQTHEFWQYITAVKRKSPKTDSYNIDEMEEINYEKQYSTLKSTFCYFPQDQMTGYVWE